MRRVVLACMAWLACGLAFASPTKLTVVPGTQADGKMTDAWYDALASRYPHIADATELHAPQPETPGQRAWHALIDSRREAWEAMVPALSVAYAPATAPAEVSILVGNRGSDDAWTAGPARICFDLAALQENYGDANTAENSARIDRFFRHEFTHILQKAWLVDHPAKMDTPTERALFEMWAEGLGNRESLSSKWIDAEGKPTETAREALDALGPKMLDRIQALRCATPAQERELTRDLSSGRFDRKWGALPVALWLAQQEAREPGYTRKFVARGPDAVYFLMGTYLPEAQRDEMIRWGATADPKCRDQPER